MRWDRECFTSQMEVSTAIRKATLLAGLAMTAAIVGACGSSNQTAPTTTTPTTQPSTTLPSTTSTQANSASTVQVWFLDTEHARTGEEPLFRPVPRTVRPPALAAGALDALFAGPTVAEKAQGLELILSGATGYSGLHIENGVAYVRLEGGCSSGGSTMTVAGEIMPTLKQFASVDHVKIYAPDGTTETPAGTSDSIPFCLEP